MNTSQTALIVVQSLTVAMNVVVLLFLRRARHHQKRTDAALARIAAANARNAAARQRIGQR